ncbi:MAG: hypothetical protein M3O70_25155 [Actinomycetota bacterium]|nr:hypothetical protein [Actinomycetota bacterium]
MTRPTKRTAPVGLMADEVQEGSVCTHHDVSVRRAALVEAERGRGSGDRAELVDADVGCVDC